MPGSARVLGGRASCAPGIGCGVGCWAPTPARASAFFSPEGCQRLVSLKTVKTASGSRRRPKCLPMYPDPTRAYAWSSVLGFPLSQPWGRCFRTAQVSVERADVQGSRVDLSSQAAEARSLAAAVPSCAHPDGVSVGPKSDCSPCGRTAPAGPICGPGTRRTPPLPLYRPRGPPGA